MLKIARILMAFALLLAAAVQPARAQVGDTEVIGGPGGAHDRDQCPEGWLLTGMIYGGDRDLNQVKAVCTRFAGGQATSDVTGLRLWGTEPEHVGASGLMTCPPNTAAEGLNVGVSRANLVHDVRLRCRNPLDHRYSLSDPSLNNGGQTAYAREANCGGGAIAVGILVHHGSLIDGLGLICRTLAAPPTPSVKPIKTTGKRRVDTPASAQSGSPSVLRVTIAGPWRLITDEGDRDTLMLQPQGGGLNGLDPITRQDNQLLPVAGSLVSADGKPDGALQGMMTADFSRMLTFQYTRRDGETGSCRLVYGLQGQSLNGSCEVRGKAIEASAQRGSWPARVPDRANAAAQKRAVDENPAQDRAQAGNAAQKGAALRSVAVKLDVDVFARAGGDGKPIGSLAAGTAGVKLIEPCQGDWCHVRWPGHEGWVYSGKDYNSLGQ